MYAHLFKIAKRKSISDEEWEILFKHGSVKNASGENLLHHYIRNNPVFDREKADKLKDVCGFDSTLRDGETIFESVYTMESDNQEEKLDWLMQYIESFKKPRRTFIFDYLKSSRNKIYLRSNAALRKHSMNTLVRPFNKTEIQVLKKFVEEDLVDTSYSTRWESLLHPSYYFTNLQDYKWFVDTFTVTGQGGNVWHQEGNVFAGAKDLDLILHLMTVFPVTIRSSALPFLIHYQPYPTIKEVLSQFTNVKIFDLSFFASHGYCDMAIRNIELLIRDGFIKEDVIRTVPDRIFRGILFGKCDIYAVANELVFIPFWEGVRTEETCGEFKPFTGKDGKPCVPTKDRWKNFQSRPFKGIYDVFVESYGPLPDKDAVRALREMFLNMARGINAGVEEKEKEIKEHLGIKNLPWRHSNAISSTTQEVQHQQQEAQVAT